MFAIRVRVRPCSARSSPRSVGRVIVTVPSSCAICMRCGTSWRSSPFGPETVTRPGSIETSTPAGTSMGLFPMRLMTGSAPSLTGRGLVGMCDVGSCVTCSFWPFAPSKWQLPDVADDFAADALGLGGATRDDAARGGHDRDAHAAEHALAAVLAGVDPPAGLGHALEVGEDALAAAAVLELDHERLVRLALGLRH